MCGEAAQPCHVPPNTGNRRHYVMILTNLTGGKEEGHNLIHDVEQGCTRSRAGDAINIEARVNYYAKIHPREESPALGGLATRQDGEFLALFRRLLNPSNPNIIDFKSRPCFLPQVLAAFS
jgi:hypothetical protein